MAVGRLIRRLRCEDVLKYFNDSKYKMTFLTLTTKDVVSYEEIRKRWRKLRHKMCERMKGVKYVMNFELHPNGHGWHIHSVWTKYIPLKGNLNFFKSCGFGRVNVQQVKTLGVADYLSKHCLKAYRGEIEQMKLKGKRLRLVNTSRGLARLSDYRWQSDFNDDVLRLVKDDEFQKEFYTFTFAQKYRVAELSILFNCSPLNFRGLISSVNAKNYEHKKAIINRKFFETSFDLSKEIMI